MRIIRKIRKMQDLHGRNIGAVTTHSLLTVNGTKKRGTINVKYF